MTHTTNSTSRPRVAILAGTAVIAIAAIVYFSFFYPPTPSNEVSGTIGAVKKYRSEQITDKDVTLSSQQSEAITAEMAADKEAANQLAATAASFANTYRELDARLKLDKDTKAQFERTIVALEKTTQITLARTQSPTYDKTAAQGTYDKTAAQGTYDKTAAQGTYDKTAAQGTYDKTAAQGTYDKTAAQGTYDKTTAQGTYDKSTAQGTYAKTSQQTTIDNAAKQTFDRTSHATFDRNQVIALNQSIQSFNAKTAEVASRPWSGRGKVTFDKNAGLEMRKQLGDLESRAISFEKSLQVTLDKQAGATMDNRAQENLQNRQSFENKPQ